ncbi:MAG TPA: hypothetical protein VF533_17920, partial [Solirubrobacteraceae bacterium]
MPSLTRVLLATSLAALALPPAAGAQLPAGDLGGGAVEVPTGQTVGAGNLLLSFRAAGAGRVTMFATFRGGCVGNTVRRTFTPAPDGAFALKGRHSSRFVFGPGRSVVRYSISGRLTPDGGTGTATSRLTSKDKGHKAVRCRGGKVAWAVRPGADPAAPPAPAPRGARL